MKHKVHKVSIKEFHSKYFDPYPRTVCLTKNPNSITKSWNKVTCKKCLRYK